MNTELGLALPRSNVVHQTKPIHWNNMCGPNNEPHGTLTAHLFRMYIVVDQNDTDLYGVT